MKFLEKVVSSLLEQQSDLSHFTIILPGKRPAVFIKKILRERNYTGLLPEFITIENLMSAVAGTQPVRGIALWLFAYQLYSEQHRDEDFAGFIKWFPTIVKDWDDMLKFTNSDTDVLEYMLDEERIKNWSENLGSNEDNPRRRFMNFWLKLGQFLPLLKNSLNEKSWATAGMIQAQAKQRIPAFVKAAESYYVFVGFNALAPAEETLLRTLMRAGKASCFFDCDNYYMRDERQEAGKFLREIQTWKEFNEHRPFSWIGDAFSEPKEISVYEVSGNITQAKVLPEILADLDDPDYSNTAIVLLDENLLPACLDALSNVEFLNITMGFPLKNLSFSNAIRQIFYIQKQLEKKESSYYYHDVLSVLEEMPSSAADREVIRDFKKAVEERNIVYISLAQMQSLLGALSYFQLFLKHESAALFLETLIKFCYELKFHETDDILFENISHFEKSFKIIRNQLTPYSFAVRMETLEVLISQLVNLEAIDFQGEPLRGLQVMGMLETRLLTFENVIILSANEGKLPLGNSQNTYLPFDVRQHFGLHTFLEGDSISAYHFYRLLQGAANVHLLFNALNSGVNTGEQSRFITQLEIEDQHHDLQHIIIENASEPIVKPVIDIEKTSAVKEKLDLWKQRISASHLTSFIYNPLDFYLTKILGTREAGEVEEELSQRSYGNLVHYALQIIYDKLVGKIVTAADLFFTKTEISNVIEQAIVKLKHEPAFYNKGMNFVHRSIAERVVQTIVEYDFNLIKSGNTLEIVGIEHQFENVSFNLNEEGTDQVSFFGYIDRIDRLNGTLRIIDYKTARTKKLVISEPKNAEAAAKMEEMFFRDEMKQAMQLCIYAYAALNMPENRNKVLQCGIWSFAEAGRGMQPLTIFDDDKIADENLKPAMNAVGNVINEILDPDKNFTELERVSY